VEVLALLLMALAIGAVIVTHRATANYERSPDSDRRTAAATAVEERSQAGVR
jgi:hypothetical protein